MLLLVSTRSHALQLCKVIWEGSPPDSLNLVYRVDFLIWQERKENVVGSNSIYHLWLSSGNLQLLELTAGHLDDWVAMTTAESSCAVFG